MKKTAIIMLLAIMAIFAIAACNAQPTGVPATHPVTMEVTTTLATEWAEPTTEESTERTEAETRTTSAATATSTASAPRPTTTAVSMSSSTTKRALTTTKASVNPSTVVRTTTGLRTTTTKLSATDPAFDINAYLAYGVAYGEGLGYRHNPEITESWDTPIIAYAALPEAYIKETIRGRLDYYQKAEPDVTMFHIWAEKQPDGSYDIFIARG